MGQIQVEKNAGGIEGLCVITPTVHGDSRGYFMETYNQKDMEEAGLTMQFVQDNQSASSKGVLRGLHFQKQYPQGKLVRVIKGCVFDVAVDLRENSQTYGKWFGVELSEENKKQFYIPEGFAQGLSASGTECFCLKRTRSSSLSRRILHMVFWYCRIMRNSAINVRTSTTRMTRAVSHGMTRKSELYGPSLPAPIAAPRPETATALMTARSCYSAIRISCGRD